MFPLEIRHHEPTTDIPENRILRTALQRMLNLERLPGEITTRLETLDHRLQGATPLTHANRHPVAGDPRQPPLRPGTAPGALVLANRSVEVATGEQVMAGFAVTMSTLYEDFVTTALAEALHRPGARHSPSTRSGSASDPTTPPHATHG